MAENQWIEENAGFGGREGDNPEEPSEPEPASSRAYGQAVPFERAFSLMTMVRLCERMLKSNPTFILGMGMLIVVGSLVRVGFTMPLPFVYDRVISGTLVGSVLHQFVFKMHLGMVLGPYVIGCVCAEVAEWARGEDPDPIEALSNVSVGGRAVAYEFMATALAWVAVAPFVLLGWLAAGMGYPGASAFFSIFVAIVGVLVWVATRPGMWAMAVDDLPPRYALMQSIVIPLRHPITVGMLFVVGATFWVVGIVMLVVPSFAVVGVLQCAFAAGWVMFGATPEEIDNSELLKKIVKVDRPRPL